MRLSVAIGRVKREIFGIFTSMNLTREKFKVLFDTHFDSIRRYLYYRCSDTELASDVAQDLFMKIWEKGREIDPVKDKALLYKMASDMIVSRFRKQKVEHNYLSSINISEVSNFNAVNESEYRELAERYSKTLSIMPEKQRTTFLMSREENLKYYEIAERLNISVKAVEKRVKGALEQLRNII